jgi:PIN domain nuclease of toxin-antitoxin system
VRLLLDTHLLLWFLDDPDALLTKAELAAVRDPRNTVAVSVVALWELATKEATGKLRLQSPVRPQLAPNDISELPVRATHVDRYRDLPLIHRDPFDRMIVAQAIGEGLTLVTRDATLLRYPVEVFGRS